MCLSRVIAGICLVLLATCLCAEEKVELPAPDGLVKVLRSSDFVQRQRTLDALAADPTAAKKYETVLRTALDDKDPAVRQQAAIVLGSFGLADRRVIDELIAGMARRSPGRYHSQPEDALSAMWAVSKIGKQAVPALLVALQDEKYPSRWMAVEALGRIGPEAKEALPVLSKLLEQKGADIEICQIVEAKWRIDADVASALSILIPLLDDAERGRSCYGAVRVLVNMRAAAKDAVPALIAALKRYEDHNVLWALGELAPHAKDVALPALRNALASPELADNAAIALQNLGEPGDDVIPGQIRRLAACRAADETKAMRIAYTIVLFGGQARRYSPELTRLLKHREPVVRQAAAWGICRVDANYAEVETLLIAAQEDPNAEVAAEVARSLKMLRDSRASR